MYPAISPRADRGSGGCDAETEVEWFVRSPGTSILIGLLRESAEAEISSEARAGTVTSARETSKCQQQIQLAPYDAAFATIATGASGCPQGPPAGVQTTDKKNLHAVQDRQTGPRCSPNKKPHSRA